MLKINVFLEASKQTASGWWSIFPEYVDLVMVLTKIYKRQKMFVSISGFSNIKFLMSSQHALSPSKVGWGANRPPRMIEISEQELTHLYLNNFSGSIFVIFKLTEVILCFIDLILVTFSKYDFLSQVLILRIQESELNKMTDWTFFRIFFYSKQKLYDKKYTRRFKMFTL